MSQRLLHSESGFIRSLQISSNNLFAFVEGGLDRSFYDRILHHSLSDKNVRYEVRAAQELPSATGGKMSTLSFFKSLRKRGNLAGVNFEKKFSYVFFLDKDIDDLSRKKIRSQHVIYTDTYDLEGHLFKCGDLSRAIADACGITFGQASAFIGNQSKWIDAVVENWKEWTILCIISQLKSINSGCTFDRASAINPDLIQATDINSLDEFKEILQQRLVLSKKDFEKLYSNLDRRISSSISSGDSLRYFKGKWLKLLTQKHVSASLTIAGATLNGVGEKVTTSLLAQVGVLHGCKCCTPYRENLEPIIRHVI